MTKNKKATQDLHDLVILLCTISNDTNITSKLIKKLLSKKLAACITLLHNVHSYYYWEDNLESQIEIQLIIKTKLSLKMSIFNEIRQLHPYKIPELLILPISDGELNYLSWMQKTMSK